MIKVDLKHAKLENLKNLIDEKLVKKINDQIVEKTGSGSEFLGWLDWPEKFDQVEYEEMKKVAHTLSKKIEILVVVGIGGSYLGSRAADEMIRGLYPKDGCKLVYVGNTISSTYTKQVLEYLENKNFGIVNISKSGTTTEPGIAFRVFENLLIKKVGAKAASELIVAITDKSKGALKTMADAKSYKTFVIPDDIGGRFSVLTPVGIFPLLVAGVNTDEILAGAKSAMKEISGDSLANNSAYQYAVARYVLNTKMGYKVETLVSYELQMQMFTEWWKQLFGESEGKDNKGLLPTSVVFSTDLHSLGQFIQDGTKGLLFETVLKIKNPLLNLEIPKDEINLDELNYLYSKSFHEVNLTALEGVIDAHANDGGIPNIILEIEEMSAKAFGYISYWFMKACAMSAYLLDVNPFNQPGVEIYKKNMFKLLGKK
ncbi:glucose-6-phosphate isomerase [Spiroplasma sabaudiense Ar-1343]|uniref:Glucose-6-phosphate isomerase n=1 Tax=Spiroplasma sabaudiense Ar-1343 TaxID=1276257 RepID=W6AAE0_9MOLU|nr:glucose-6-phosphate isomerase [Spiroplasma sabaudiense]AHI54027.1 glucose-6-phosphate isomerase [Spiroplasma sabaudiense Ar-1343]